MKELSFLSLVLLSACGGRLSDPLDAEEPTISPPPYYPEWPTGWTPYVLSWVEVLPGGPLEPTSIYSHFEQDKGPRDGLFHAGEGYLVTSLRLCERGDSCPVDMELTLPNLDPGTIESAALGASRLNHTWFSSAEASGQGSIEVEGRNEEEVWGRFSGDLCTLELSWGEVCLHVMDGFFRLRPGDARE